MNEKVTVSDRKTIHVAAAVIRDNGRIFATQRGYGGYKDWWEFPGGKIESGETPEEALVREIREELETTVVVDRFLTTVEYDYPEFHLVMDCFWCYIREGRLTLLEHEAAKWLPVSDLRQVKWLPADVLVIDEIERQGSVNKPIRLEPLPQVFSVCKLTDFTSVDLAASFVFTAATDEENSLVCPTGLVPENAVRRDDGWRCFRVCGELDFSLIGILAGISKVLAEEKIGIFVVSTFNTDYVLTKEVNFEKALSALKRAGYQVVE